jgi:hypothetical protein
VKETSVFELMGFLHCFTECYSTESLSDVTTLASLPEGREDHIQTNLVIAEQEG